MLEYIDRNLIEWYGCNFEDGNCKNRECSGCSHAECSHSQVMQIPPADVIEREKIDKAIEELCEKVKNRGFLSCRSDYIQREIRSIFERNIGE